MRRRFGLLPAWAILVFAVLFAIAESASSYLEWNFRPVFQFLIMRPSTFFLIAAAVVYAIFRAGSTHPFYDSGYREWLAHTPWHVAKPLPLGPIEFVWQDAVVLGTFLLLSLFDPDRNAMDIINAYLLANIVFLLVPLWIRQRGEITYLATFLGLLAIRLWSNPWLCFAASSACYLVTHEGTWRLMARFPWPEQSNSLIHRPDRTPHAAGGLGWPFEPLYQEVRDCQASEWTPRRCLAISLLFGWALYCIGWPTFNPNRPPALAAFLLGITCIFSFVLRATFVASHYCSPMKLGGRLAAGQWIIPKHDYIWAEPAIALVAAPCLIMLSRLFQVSFEYSYPLVLVLYMNLMLLPAPARLKWILTGGHRIVHGMNESTEKIHVKVG